LRAVPFALHDLKHDCAARHATNFMPSDSALSIFMLPDVTTSHADLCFGKLIPAISFLAIQTSALPPSAPGKKAQFLQPHKNDRPAAPVPTDCVKTLVSILLRYLTATIAAPEIGITMQPWNTTRATICGVAIGLAAAAVKLVAPWSEPHGGAVAIIQEFVGAGLAFGLLCGVAAALRNFVARWLI
jgi:hypothetical protein